MSNHSRGQVRQLVLVEPGYLRWDFSPAPILREPDDAIVRPVAATTCDLDRLMILGRAPFTGPVALGHECVAEVLEVGPAVSELRPGQLVVVNWHISCGTCDRCRGHKPNACRLYPPGAMFGLAVGGDWGGMFSDQLRVPHAPFALSPLPADIDPIHVASAGDNLPFGYEVTVPHLQREPGAPLLIIGGSGSIGLYAVMFAAAAGSSQVDYLDTSPERLEIAEKLGARALPGPIPHKVGSYPIVVDASTSPEGLQCALRSSEREGVVTSVGSFHAEVPIPLASMYARGTHFYIGRGKGGPNVAVALDWVASGRVTPQVLVSEVQPFDMSPDVLRSPSLKPVLFRSPISSPHPIGTQENKL